MTQTEEKCNQVSNPAKLLAAYMNCSGITCAKIIAETLDIPLRTVQRLKLEAATLVDVTSAKDATCAISGVSADATCAKDAISGVSEPEALACADKTTRATKESFQDTPSQEVRKNPQTPNGGFHDQPSNVIPVKSWNTAFDQFDPSAEIVRDQFGRIRLLGQTRAKWEAKFGGPDSLDLVMTEITGEVNEGSRKPLVADVEARLAKKIRDKIERDQRYMAAAAANKAALSAPRKLSRY